MNRSRERDVPKGGRAEAIPIHRKVLVYLDRAMSASRSELVFPGPDGNMPPRSTKLERVLRRAMRRRGLRHTTASLLLMSGADLAATRLLPDTGDRSEGGPRGRADGQENQDA